MHVTNQVVVLWCTKISNLYMCRRSKALLTLPRNIPIVRRGGPLYINISDRMAVIIEVPDDSLSEPHIQLHVLAYGSLPHECAMYT